MSWQALVAEGLASLRPHLVALSLVAARLAPVAFLSPVFGGRNAPAQLKLSVVLVLALFIHAAAGVDAPPEAAALMGYLAAAARETVLGLAIGLVTALPFDGSRIAGRWVDVFRGSSAEAALPWVGSSDAASADLLHQLLLALTAASTAYPLVISGLVRSFGATTLGLFALPPSGAEAIAALLGVTFSTAFALAAPTLGVTLTVDLALALAGRAAPSLSLTDSGAPLRLLAGAAALCLTLGVLANRGLELQADLTEAWRHLTEVGP